MIRYGDERWQELRFISWQAVAERRDAHWIDVTLRVETAPDTPLPEDLIDFAIAVFCTHEGYPVQMAALDEGCDCDYQLTETEQEQVRRHIASPDMQRLIAQAANAARTEAPH